MPAIQATFSDFKTVKTRGVAQLVMEVPIEQANAALAALGGVPMHGKEQWVGIAPINAEATQKRPVEKKPMGAGQYAAMMCQNQHFWKFLGASGAHDAADRVRTICDVGSRSEITTSTQARAKWDALLLDYDVWRGKVSDPEARKYGGSQ